MQKTHFLGEVTFAFSTQIICFVLGVIGTILIARALGPSGKGAIAMLALIPGVLSLVGKLGIGSANAYFVAKNPKLIGYIFSNSLLMAFMLGGLLIIATHLFSMPIIERFAKGLDPYYLSIVLISIPFLLFIDYSTNILQGSFRFKEFNLLNLTKYSSRLFFILLFILVLKKEVLGGAMLITLSSVVTALFGGIVCIRGVDTKLKTNLKILKDSLSYGIRGHIGNVINFVTYRADIFFISFFVGVGGVGIYTVSVAFAEILLRLPGAINLVLLPKTSASLKRVSADLTSQISRIVFPFSIILASIFVLISRPLISLLFGDRFDPSFTPLWILLIGVVPLTLSKIFTSYLAGRGKLEYVTYQATVSMIITIVLNILLIPRFGIVGAAIASSVSYISATLVVVRGFLKDSNLTLFSVILPSRKDITILQQKFRTGISR